MTNGLEIVKAYRCIDDRGRAGGRSQQVPAPVWKEGRVENIWKISKFEIKIKSPEMFERFWKSPVVRLSLGFVIIPILINISLAKRIPFEREAV